MDGGNINLVSEKFSVIQNGLLAGFSFADLFWFLCICPPPHTHIYFASDVYYGLGCPTGVSVLKTPIYSLCIPRDSETIPYKVKTLSI